MASYADWHKKRAAESGLYLKTPILSIMCWNLHFLADYVKYSFEEEINTKTPFLSLQEMGFHFLRAIGHPLG
jgi:hypothetical protein